MNIATATTPERDVYKLLTNIVVPRPIGWVTSRNADGVLNLAPFSFFNCVGSAPPLVILGIGTDVNDQPKHTAANIQATKNFVVNVVTEEFLQAMNITAANFPADESEIPAAGLTVTPSAMIDVPRVSGVKAALECTLESYQRIGGNNLVIGRVLSIFVDDQHIDPARLYIRNFLPIGRLGAPSVYCRTTDRFELPRLAYEQAKKA